jgi:cytochrome c-type biogenesis protein
MNSFMGALLALWLGILTSISPCPLATNIAAISYIGRRIGTIRAVLMSGLFYTLGRMITYVLIGSIVVTGILSIPSVSMFLQNKMNTILGPLLILIGMVLLELIPITFSGINLNENVQNRIGNYGIFGAILLGILFACAFCPVSAAIFFGSLIPLSIKYESQVLFLILYGIGTGLPVFLFAIFIAFSAKTVGTIFNKLTIFEKWARWITGIVFIIIGMYLTSKYIFNIL